MFLIFKTKEIKALYLFLYHSYFQFEEVHVTCEVILDKCHVKRQVVTNVHCMRYKSNSHSQLATYKLSNL